MTFSSVYEMFNPLTTVRKQHWWEWFSGDDLKSTSNFKSVNASPTGTMNDEVDGGYNVLFSSSAYSWGGITHGNKRQFIENNVAAIWVVKRVMGADSGGYWAGVSNVENTTQNDTMAISTNTASSANFFLYLKGTITSNTDSSSPVTVNDNWNVVKVQADGTDIKGYINGVLEMTVVGSMGTTSVQPSCTGIHNPASSGDTIDIRYGEVYSLD
jgi:hypothetical protein